MVIIIMSIMSVIVVVLGFDGKLIDSQETRKMDFLGS